MKLSYLAVHVLVLMAIWNPLQHMRRQYHAHVRRAWQMMSSSRPIPACPFCGETRFVNRIADQFGGDAFEYGTAKQFACGTVLNSHGTVPMRYGDARNVMHGLDAEPGLEKPSSRTPAHPPESRCGST